MFRQIIVLLSQDGLSLSLYARDQSTQHAKAISDVGALDQYKDWWIVKHHRTLLEALMQSQDPLQCCVVLGKLQEKMKDHATKENFEDAFRFLQVCDSCAGAILHSFSYIPGLSASSRSSQAREQSLEQMIKAIEESYDALYGLDKRSNFINGFNYQQLSAFNPMQLTYAFSGGEEFEAGRNAAKITHTM